MKRKIIKIDEDKCIGCGLCAEACHEGAIGMVDGKAKLLRDDYCDGLGDCLPVCPTDAISFEEREAAEYDAEAVKQNMARKRGNHSGGCPGSRVISLGNNTTSDHNESHGEHGHNNSPAHYGGCPGSRMQTFGTEHQSENAEVRITEPRSRLAQWPVQIKLVPINAPYFDGAKLLVAADCTAFAYGNFHEKFIKDHVTLIGCPKLDDGDYSEKLGAIIRENNIKSVTVVRMEVPCCGGIAHAVTEALKNSGKMIPWQIITLSLDGKIIDG